MRYLAELTKSVAGERVSLGNEEYGATDDQEAIKMAGKWVEPLLTLHFNEVIHLQVTRNGFGVFGKVYGNPDA